MRISARIGVVLWCVFWLVGVQGQEMKMSNEDIASFKKSLAKREKMNTLSADFTQYKKIGYVKKDMVSSGRFYIKSPDRLAWIYTAPLKYSMVFKDKKIYINDRGKKKSMDLSRSKQFEKISQAIHANVGGGTYQGNEFSPSYYQSSSYYILKLEPIGKELKKAMKQIVLYYDKVNYQIAELQLIEPSDGYTRFVLRNQKLNVALDDAVFEGGSL